MDIIDILCNAKPYADISTPRQNSCLNHSLF